MKYYFIDIDIFSNNLSKEQIDNQLKLHLEYLDTYFDNKTLLIGVSKINRKGGFVIAKFKSGKAVKEFYENDPMYKRGLLNIQVTPFNIYRENLNTWLA